MDDKMRVFTKTLKENNGYRSFRKIIKSDKYNASKILSYKEFCSLVKEQTNNLNYWILASIIWKETSEGCEFWGKIASKLYMYSYYD